MPRCATEEEKYREVVLFIKEVNELYSIDELRLNFNLFKKTKHRNLTNDSTLY
jgi:hypothetical protein